MYVYYKIIWNSLEKYFKYVNLLGGNMGGTEVGEQKFHKLYI